MDAAKHGPYMGKPYNRYNIFYMLERERMLQSNSSYKKKPSGDLSGKSTHGYEDLDLPDLPPQYASLDLSSDWFVPGRRMNKKRVHKKTHGLASFQEIARVVADGWKNIDETTLDFCTVVAEILKQRHKEIKSRRESTIRSQELPKIITQPRPPNETNSESLWCNGSVAIPPLPGYFDVHSIYGGHYRSKSPRATAEVPRSLVGLDYSDNSSPLYSDHDSPPPGKMFRRSSTASMSEVDIPDQDIMSMWNHTS
jgi:hypothetical protein